MFNMIIGPLHYNPPKLKKTIFLLSNLAWNRGNKERRQLNVSFPISALLSWLFNQFTQPFCATQSLAHFLTPSTS